MGVPPPMRRLAAVLSVLWIVNFVTYGVTAILLGGDAVNGHAEAGRYYLAMHGRLTEVSRPVFEFSRWYTYVLFAHSAVVLAISVWSWLQSPRTPAA